MLAPSWTYTANTQHSNYLPPRPSPLSPRSANVYPPRFTWGRETMSKKNNNSNVLESSIPQRDSTPLFQQPQASDSAGVENALTGTRHHAPQTAFSQRGGAKPNPLLRKEDGQRERRRDLFMKKVEKGREDKRWEGRTEQILRSDYILQQRRWEEERARSAPDFIPGFDVLDDEEEDLSPSVFSRNTYAYPLTPRLSAHQMEDDEVDAVAQMEEQELRELIALAEESSVPHMHMETEELDIPSSPTRYGSDEEEYEDIFMELVSSQGALVGGLNFEQPLMQQLEVQEHHEQEDVDMDMSGG